MKIIFVLKDKTKIETEFSEGETVLEVAHKNGININSYCEGSGLCGSCHVIVENNGLLDKPSEIEELALDNAKGVTIKSRLACRIVLNSKHDGLVINTET